MVLDKNRFVAHVLSRSRYFVFLMNKRILGKKNIWVIGYISNLNNIKNAKKKKLIKKITTLKGKKTRLELPQIIK